MFRLHMNTFDGITLIYNEMFRKEIAFNIPRLGILTHELRLALGLPGNML